MFPSVKIQIGRGQQVLGNRVQTLLQHKFECHTKFTSRYDEVELGCNNIGDEGLKYLSKVDWNCLWWLNLTENNIQNEGCHSIVNAKMSRLRMLFLCIAVLI